MKNILILSDIHSNWEALKTILNDENYDLIMCAGDLVDFGPCPKEVVDFFRISNCFSVMGNHDWAVISGNDPGSTNEIWKSICMKSAHYTKNVLGADNICYIKHLPFEKYIDIEGTRFYIVHAAPSNHLYKYIEPSASIEELEKEFNEIDADYIIIGHTHLPMIRKIKKSLIINPGSVGQPKDGNPDASYAIFSDNGVLLKRKSYDIEKIISSYSKLPFNDIELKELSLALRTGGKYGKYQKEKQVPRPKKLCE